MPLEFYRLYARDGILEFQSYRQLSVKHCKMLDKGIVNDDSFEMIARRTKQAGAEFTCAK